MILRHRVVAALALAALASPVAYADDSKLDAKSLMQSGVKLFEAHDYLGALAVFKDAYARFASAKILLNIGTTLRLLDREADAANAYQRYLDSPDADPHKRAEVTAAIAELDAKVGRLEITSTPSDAEIQIGEDVVPVAHTRLVRVTAGEVTLDARKPGYQPTTQTVQAVVGQAVDVEVSLAPIPVPVAPPPLRPPGADDGVVARVEPMPRSALGLSAIVHVDPVNKGAAALVGVTYDVARHVELDAAAILGTTQGGSAGANVELLTGALRPTLGASALVFDSNGARWALRGAAGIELVANRHLAFVLELGVERDLNPEMSIKPTLFVPALGAIGRL